MGILDNMFSVAKDVAKTTTKKTGEVVELSKLKFKSMNIIAEIKITFEKIGNACYAKNREGKDNENEIRNLLLQVDRLFEEQKEIEEKVLSIKEKKRCDSCGYKVSLHNNYCYNCGEYINDCDQIKSLSE